MPRQSPCIFLASAAPSGCTLPNPPTAFNTTETIRIEKIIVEMQPFAAAIRAGAKLVMTAHVALPALSGSADLPATLSPAILRGPLRREPGFERVMITDALDMKAIRQGSGLVIDAIAGLTGIPWTRRVRRLCAAPRPNSMPHARSRARRSG